MALTHLILIFFFSFAQGLPKSVGRPAKRGQVSIGLYHESSQPTSRYHEEIPGTLNIGSQIVINGRFKHDQMVHLKEPRGELVVNLFSGRMKNPRADFPLSMKILFAETTIKEIVFTSKISDVSKQTLPPIKIPLQWSLKNGMFEVMITVQETDYNIALNGIRVGLIPHSMSYRTIGTLHYRGPKEWNQVVEFTNLRFFQSN